MLKRTLFFSTPYHLSLKNSQMLIRAKEEQEENLQSVPVEDIGCIVLEDPQISITLPLLNSLSENNAAVIFCGTNRMPQAMLMNLDANSTQGEIYRDQINASLPLKKNLWKQIVETKIRNQAVLLDKLGKDGSRLKPYYNNVKSGDSDNREGVSAKLYWKELFGNDFVRHRDGDAPNNMLNYGYILLRAAVARALMGSGLFPAFGIFHRNRYNAFPLADDIMEPFRPYVDEKVFELWMQGKRDLSKDAKAYLLQVLFTDTLFDDLMRPLEVGISMTTASLAKCFSGKQKRLILPAMI